MGTMWSYWNLQTLKRLLVCYSPHHQVCKVFTLCPYTMQDSKDNNWSTTYFSIRLKYCFTEWTVKTLLSFTHQQMLLHWIPINICNYNTYRNTNTTLLRYRFNATSHSNSSTRDTSSEYHTTHSIQIVNRSLRNVCECTQFEYTHRNSS